MSIENIPDLEESLRLVANSASQGLQFPNGYAIRVNPVTGVWERKFTGTENSNPEGHNQFSSGGGSGKEPVKHISRHTGALEEAAGQYTHDGTKVKAAVRDYINQAKDVEDSDTLKGTQSDRVEDFHTFIKEGGSDHIPSPFTHNAAPNQPRHSETGQYLHHGAGTGKGEVHRSAVDGHKLAFEPAEDELDEDDAPAELIGPDQDEDDDGRDVDEIVRIDPRRMVEGQEEDDHQFDDAPGRSGAEGTSLSMKSVDGKGIRNEEVDAVSVTYNRRWPQSKRDNLPSKDFAGPDQSFPIRSQEDVDSAAKLVGHADNPEAVRKRIKSIADRKGLNLPDSWKEDEEMATKNGKKCKDCGEDMDTQGRCKCSSTQNEFEGDYCPKCGKELTKEEKEDGECECGKELTENRNGTRNGERGDDMSRVRNDGFGAVLQGAKDSGYPADQAAAMAAKASGEGLSASAEHASDKAKTAEGHATASTAHSKAAKAAKASGQKSKAAYHRGEAKMHKSKAMDMAANNKAATINLLVANCSCWKDVEGRKVLNSMSRGKVASIFMQNAFGDEEDEDEEDEEDEDKGKGKGGKMLFGKKVQNAKSDSSHADEIGDGEIQAGGEEDDEDSDDLDYPDKAKKGTKVGKIVGNTSFTALVNKYGTPAERAMWENGIAIHNQAKEQLIHQLTANSQGRQKRGLIELYNSMDIPQLRLVLSGQQTQGLTSTHNTLMSVGNDGFGGRLRNGLGTGVETPIMPNYIGANPVANMGEGTNNSEGDDEPLVLPTMNWGKDE